MCRKCTKDIIQIFELLLFREGNDYYILTKGDENQVDDRALYEPGQHWLHKSDLEGKIIG